MGHAGDCSTCEYELIYGYMHCIGKTFYHAGFVDSEEAAARWVRQSASEDFVRARVPDKDPIRWCPVRRCHMKFQTPWFSYRRVRNPGKPENGSQPAE